MSLGVGKLPYGQQFFPASVESDLDDFVNMPINLEVLSALLEVLCGDSPAAIASVCLVDLYWCF